MRSESDSAFSIVLNVELTAISAAFNVIPSAFASASISSVFVIIYDLTVGCICLGVSIG